MGVSFFLFKLCCLTAMSGFLFGYDTGIVSGSMIFIKDEMRLSTIWIEIIVSSTIGFAWITAWLSSNLTFYMGRKPLIILASALFTLASAIMGLATSKYILLLGRAVAGMAIGLGSMIAPIYLAELSPKEKRGSLVTFNSAFVTFGILASTMIASLFAHLPEHIGWRFMLGFAGIPSLFQMIGFFFMPESPRYLCQKGLDNEALEVMIKIYDQNLDKAKEEIRSIKESFAKDNEKQMNNQNYIDKSNIDGNNNGFVNHELTKSTKPANQSGQDYMQKLAAIFRDPKTRHYILIGICLHIGQQFCGINTIMYYGATVIQMSGVLSKRVAIMFTVIVGITNAVTSFIALFVYDRVTRVRITLASMCGIVVCLALMGAVFVKVENQVVPIRNLNDSYPNMSSHYLKLIDYCRSIDTCGGCVTNKICGYCFDSNNVENTGRCLPRSPSNPLKSIINTKCANGSIEEADLYFTTSNCPSDYGVYTLVTLCLFLVWYAFGMGATPWTINAEIYPMWCRGVAVSFATGFNWLFNLIVSISFLTITEYFNVSGAFFLYMTVSIVLTVVYYFWLPETSKKTMEEDAIVFRH